MNPAYGGPVTGIIDTIKVLAKSGHEGEVVSLDPPGAPWLKTCPVNVHPLGPVSALSDRAQRFVPWDRYGFSRRYVAWLRENAAGFDVVVVNGVWNYGSVGAWRALRRSKTPYVLYSHGMLDPWFVRAYPLKGLGKRLFWAAVETHVAARAFAVLFTTDQERLLATSMYRPWRSRDIVVGYGVRDVPYPKGVATGRFLDRVPEVNGRRYILFLSRIDRKKGCDILLSSFAQLAQKHSDIDLVIAGPGSKSIIRDLRRQAEALQISRRVHFPGMLLGEEKWGAYYGAEAFTLATHSENFGVVLAEAMACGIPVITTNKANIWATIAEGEAGLIAEDTVGSFASALSRFFQLSGLDRAQLRANARRTFEESFLLDRTIPLLMATLANAAAKPPGSQHSFSKLEA